MNRSACLRWLVLAMIPSLAAGVTYYVSNDGNDLSSGTDVTTAWRTISRVNLLANTRGQQLMTGDQVLFRRGDVFKGVLLIQSTTAANLVISSYGNPADEQPLISGGIEVPGDLWRLYDPRGIYVADLTALMRSYDIVTMPVGNLYYNRAQQRTARWPNYVGQTIESFAIMTSFNQVTRATTSSADLLLPRFTRGYFNGATYHIRQNDWTYLLGTVLNFRRETTVGTFDMSNPYIPANLRPYGFFIDNLFGELDAPEEYYWDAAGKKLYFYPADGQSPSTGDVELAYLEKGIYVYYHGGNITISDIHFQYQTFAGVVFNGKSFNSNVIGCTFEDIEGSAINTGWIITGGTFADNTIFNMGGQGIVTSHAYNITIDNNDIFNIGLMDASPGGALSGYQGICGSDMFTSTISNNRVSQIAGQGMLFGGAAYQLLIINNVVDSTMLRINDGGCIYLGSGIGMTTGSMFVNNRLTNCVGSIFSINSGPGTHGLYFDGGGGNFVYNNTIGMAQAAAIKMSNNPNNVVVGNTFFDSAGDLMIITNQVLNPFGNVIACNNFNNEGGGGILGGPKNAINWATLKDNYYCSTQPMWWKFLSNPSVYYDYDSYSAATLDTGGISCATPGLTWSCNPVNYVTNPAFLAQMPDTDALTMSVRISTTPSLFSLTTFLRDLALDLGVASSRVSNVATSNGGTTSVIARFTISAGGARAVAQNFRNKVASGVLRLGTVTSVDGPTAPSTTSLRTVATPTYTGDGISVCSIRSNSVASFRYFLGAKVDAPDWQSCCNKCGAIANCTLFQFYTTYKLLRGNCQLSNQNQAGPLASVYWNPAPLVDSGVPTTRGARPQTTGARTTAIQTTASRTTGVQTTGVRTTAVQTTAVQTTGVQTTGVQRTTGAGPTVPVRTTGVQTTGVQTTGVQTTAIQTTGVQTTAIQTTGVQTTGVQTTAVQTTGVQTTGPVQGTPTPGNSGIFTQTYTPSTLKQRGGSLWYGNVISSAGNAGSTITSTGSTDGSLSLVDGVTTYVAMASGSKSGTLSAVDLGINIGQGNTFVGMTITVRGRASVAGRATNQIKLQRDNVDIGGCSDNCPIVVWPAIDTTYTFGSPTDTWGLTADQLGDGFTAGLLAANSLLGSTELYIDYYSITLYIQTPRPTTGLRTTGIQTTSVQTTGVQTTGAQTTRATASRPNQSVVTRTVTASPTSLWQDWLLNAWYAENGDARSMVARFAAEDHSVETSSDTTRVSTNVTAGVFSAPINAANFGFNIPATAVITDVKLTLTQAATWFNTIFFNQMRLQVGGVALGTCASCECVPLREGDAAGSSPCSSYWPGGRINFRATNYGSNAASWSMTTLPAPSVVNSATFGVKLQIAGAILAYANAQALLQQVQLTVTYQVSSESAQQGSSLLEKFAEGGGAAHSLIAGFVALVVVLTLAIVAVVLVQRSGGPSSVRRRLGGLFGYGSGKSATAEIPVTVANVGSGGPRSSSSEEGEEEETPRMLLAGLHRERLSDGAVTPTGGLHRSTDRLMSSTGSMPESSPVLSPLKTELKATQNTLFDENPELHRSSASISDEM